MLKKLAAAALAASAILFNQAAAQRPTFEVASIKSTDPADRRTMFDTPPNGRFRAAGVSLKLLIAKAYNIQLTQIAGGPAWLDVDRFDIEAKAESADSYQRITSMLQALLEDRFQLASHWETRQEPVYELIAAKGGPKLRDVTANPGPTRQQMGRGQVMATATPIVQLIPLLSLLANRQVVDKTGLSGVYDFTLTYAFDVPGPNAPPPIDPNAPSIFTALEEQLGLKLESARGPVNVLVVERAEQPDLN